MQSISCSGYCHVVPGRVRVRVTKIKGQPETARSLELLLSGQPGIGRVRANPLTGNVLVSYEPAEMTHEEVLCRLEDLGHLPIPHIREARTPQPDPLVYVGAHLGRNLAKFVLKQALRGSPVGLICELL